MKKKLIILALSLFLINVINAQKRTEQQALEKAKEFMKDKSFSNKERSLKRAIAKEGKEDNNAFSNLDFIMKYL